ncbi:MAG: response regulator transcription factor [Bacteroides sp.]|nr:response regulator transcription factor [Bacteroides sp.]
MKLSTLIIDDEPIALQKLRKYVEQTDSLSLAAECSDGFEALRLLSSRNVDLIITDINMPDLNGLEFIRSLPEPPMVIFTTAHPQFAVDSYKVSAIDYLLKPFGFDSFSTAIAKAVAHHSSRSASEQPTAPDHIAATSQPESLFVKVDYRYIRLALSSIRFIKGYGEYLQIHIDDKPTPLVTLSSFAAIIKALPDNFLQVHRSYIVNLDRIQLVERNRIVMDSGDYIPVGDSYKAVFQTYIASRTIGSR